MRSLAVLALMLCALAPSAMAADAVRPHRLVRLFDFEERALGNFEDMPMNWYAVGRDPLTSDPVFLRQPAHQHLISRPGFPSFTKVGFDTARAHSGDLSLHLGLDGGSAGAFLEIGAVTAVAGSEYLVTAMVQTAGLSAAGARLAASFVDAGGRTIPGSRAVSDPVRTTGQWQPIAVKLRSDHADAAYIQIEALLLQPGPRPGDPLGANQLVLQDVGGDAWFDDIAIWQLPRVEIGTDSPVGVITAPQTPELAAVVRDLTARQLQATVGVYDIDGRLVDEHTRSVGAGEPTEWRWSPRLPAFGWYFVQLAVQEPRGGSLERIAQAHTAFQWLPNLSPLVSADRRRFGIDAQRAEPAVLDLLDDLMLRTRLQRATISVWDADTRLETLDDRQAVLDDVIGQVLRQDGEVVLSLDPLPTSLAQKTGVPDDDPLGALQSEPGRWQPLLAPVLLRQGQRVPRWQIGAVERVAPFFATDLDAALAPASGILTQMVPSPQMILPWSIDQSRREAGEASYVLAVPPAVTPESLGAYLEPWQSPPASVWLQFASASAEQVSQRQRVRDLALKMVRAWQHGAPGMSIARPWTDAQRRELALVPDPRLGVFANVAQQLAGRRVVGELDLRAGVACLILDGPAGGMLIAWNDHAPAGAALDMWMGPDPVATDIWGNRETVSEHDGRHVLPLGRDPLFITGINAQLALFRAGFRLDPPMIESRQVPHARTLTLTNPWPRTISGHLQILGPEDWSISPSRHYFSIAAGRSVALPVEVVFPVSEVAGQKQLTARFDFDADVHYLVDLATPMQLGLPGVSFDATASLTQGEAGTDLLLVCIITNTSEQPQSLLCFASLPGHPRQTRPVSRLEPGETAIRRFRFENAAEALKQYPVRTGVRDVNGPAILNHKIQIDPMP